MCSAYRDTVRCIKFINTSGTTGYVITFKQRKFSRSCTTTPVQLVDDSAPKRRNVSLDGIVLLKVKKKGFKKCLF